MMDGTGRRSRCRAAGREALPAPHRERLRRTGPGSPRERGERGRSSPVFGAAMNLEGSHRGSEPGRWFRGAVRHREDPGVVPTAVETPSFPSLPPPGARIPLLPGSATAPGIPKFKFTIPKPNSPSSPNSFTFPGDAPRRVRPRSAPVAAGLSRLSRRSAPRGHSLAHRRRRRPCPLLPRPRRAAGSGGRGSPGPGPDGPGGAERNRQLPGGKRRPEPERQRQERAAIGWMLKG